MRLGTFILARQHDILRDWDAFAKSIAPSGVPMTQASIRDHAADMLAAIAADLAEAQTADQQFEKSQGQAPVIAGAPHTAAQTHALLRAQSGFDINQMAAEYRALRATVLRLWGAEFTPTSSDLQDVIRFNEAIDQSLAESIAAFNEQLERSRNLLLGMVGHDMRNPLSVIVLTARHLSKLDADSVVSQAAARLISSGARLRALLDELVDFNRTTLGLGIRIAPRPVNLTDVFVEQLDLLRAAHPGRNIVFEPTGDLVGSWDANRLHQVLGNLVTNALKYGDHDQPVRVELRGAGAEVIFSVENQGAIISPELASVMFEPLTQGAAGRSGTSPDGSLGLGLFITKEVIRAHGGTVDLTSTSAGTAFTVRLPRDAVAVS